VRDGLGERYEALFGCTYGAWSFTVDGEIVRDW
jgi:hypothetical protein